MRALRTPPCVEAYQKKLENIRPRYENLSKDVLFFPELEETIVFFEPESDESRGLELYLRRDTGGKFSWWTTYALARVQERIAGVDVPKNQDQRHTVYVDLNYRPTRKWHISLAWQYHSGWPYSERIFVPADKPPGEFPFEESFGPRNAARLPVYHRMDLRVNRHFKLGDGRGSIFIDIFNLYDRGNVQARFPRARWQGPGFPVEFDGTFDEEWLPLLPSIGARWEL